MIKIEQGILVHVLLLFCTLEVVSGGQNSVFRNVTSFIPDREETLTSCINLVGLAELFAPNNRSLCCVVHQIKKLHFRFVLYLLRVDTKTYMKSVRKLDVASGCSLPIINRKRILNAVNSSRLPVFKILESIDRDTRSILQRKYTKLC